MKYKISRYYSYVQRLFPYLLYFIPALIISLFIKRCRKFQDIWLIADRGDEARDNGYHLFKYIKENNLQSNVYFVITVTSPDKSKVAKFGNNIKTNSFIHFLYFIMADKLISSHIYGAAPNGKACLPFLSLLPKKKHINLKHGITKDDINLKDKNQNIIVCTSDKEVKNFNSSSKEVREAIKILGFCRFDNLIDKAKYNNNKTILIMPTFRLWLEDSSRFSNSDTVFKRDPYFNWNYLINNDKLINFLENNNYQLVFYPHYRIQKYLHNFDSNSDNVVIASNKNFDVQDLLRTSSVIITDYSSVFFDFAYMNKPVIYYQFDQAKYRNKHYKSGSFSYEKDGFGPVYTEASDVINHIIEISEKNFKMDEKYLNRVRSFYKYYDTNNNLRNYNEIIKLNNVK